MKKILSILSITFGSFLLMLVIGMVIFGVDGPTDQTKASTQTTNSTNDPAETSETSLESSRNDQPNASKQSLEVAYSQMVAVEQKLKDIKANNYQITMDEAREIYQEANKIDVSSIIKDDLTADGFDQVIKNGTNTSPISGMSRAIDNLFDLANDPTSVDALDNFNGNLEEFSANLPKVRAVLDQDELWEGTK